MADGDPKLSIEEFESGGANPLTVDKIGPTLDVKTTTVNGIAAQAAAHLNKYDSLEGLKTFKGMILRKETSSSDGLLSKLFSGNVLKYKVRVPELHVHLPIPDELGDSTGKKAKAIIDQYPDFTYEPMGFMEDESFPGDIVNVTFGNLSNFTDGKVLNKVGPVPVGNGTAGMGAGGDGMAGGMPSAGAGFAGENGKVEGETGGTATVSSPPSSAGTQRFVGLRSFQSTNLDMKVIAVIGGDAKVMPVKVYKGMSADAIPNSDSWSQLRILMEDYNKRAPSFGGIPKNYQNSRLVSAFRPNRTYDNKTPFGGKITGQTNLFDERYTHSSNPSKPPKYQKEWNDRSTDPPVKGKTSDTGIGGQIRVRGLQKQMTKYAGATTATPGTSNHQSGMAVDFDSTPKKGQPGFFDGAQRKLTFDIIRQRGLQFDAHEQASANENWHWSFVAGSGVATAHPKVKKGE